MQQCLVGRPADHIDEFEGGIGVLEERLEGLDGVAVVIAGRADQRDAGVTAGTAGDGRLGRPGVWSIPRGGFCGSGHAARHATDP
jgi:hypothetical protein